MEKSTLGNVKKQNLELFLKIIDWLVESHDLIPMGQLAVFLHALNGLGLKWGCCGDIAEKRNREYYLSLNPQYSELLVDAIISGSFKPHNFVHPFESYITTTGALDSQVLPEIFKTVDDFARNHALYEKRHGGAEYLAFIYIFFLAIHPFVDGNGRVARNLLDYYNKRTGLKLKDVWNHPLAEYMRKGKTDRPSNSQRNYPKFDQEDAHKDAFKTFYEEDVGLAPHCNTDTSSVQTVSSFIVERKTELISLVQYIIRTTRKVREGRSVEYIKGVKVMAGLITSLQNEK